MVIGITVQADEAAVRHDIQALYDRASAASITARTLQDLDAIHDWLDTPDCVYADAGEPRRTWAAMRSYAAQGLQTRLKTFSSRILDLEVRGSTAIATTLVRGVAPIADSEGRFGPKGAIHDVETTATVRDVWTRAAGSWRRQSHDKIVANAITAVDGEKLK